jgi:drug/metabolite transporter (DMT)-like permease
MSERANPIMGAAEWALLLVLSVLWGGAFFFGKLGVSALPPLVVALLRVGIAALVLMAVARLAGARLPRDWRTWRALFIMGILNNVIPFVLILWGQTHIASGLAAILNATTPLFGVIVAQLAGGQERLTAPRLAGVLLGLLGVAAMIGPGLTGGLAGDTLAELACLGAALSYAFAGVFGRRALRDLPPLVTATGQLVASTTILLPIVLVATPGLLDLRPALPVLAAIVALAVAGTALAYVIYFRILAAAGSTNILLVTLLIPVSAVLLGGIFLGERLEARHALGMALIALGLAAIDGRLLRRLRRARA